MKDHNECRECLRVGLTLTSNGRIRTHTADGGPVTPSNPNCGGGSGFPRGVDHEVQQPVRRSR